MGAVRTHGITTHSHRDYTDNGPALVISKAEAKQRIDKFNAKYKAGKISAPERDLFTSVIAKRVVPL